MAECILELIRANILTTLADVTVANGYSGTLNVDSVARWGNTTGDLDTIVEQGTETVLGETDADGAVGQDTYIQEFLIFVHIQEPADSATAFDTRCNRAMADVRKAIMADLTRGGYALRTEKSATNLFVNEAGHVGGIMLTFRVHYRTKIDNPLSQ